METGTYIARRGALREKAPSGVILLLGLDDAPRNYLGNVYPFRQDSHFLYYVGTNAPGLAAVLLPDGREILFGPPGDPEDVIWHGPHLGLRDHAQRAGIEQTQDISALAGLLGQWISKGVKIHYLPPYRAEQTIKLARLLGKAFDDVAGGASMELARVIVEQRSLKSPQEVAEIEDALGASAAMYQAAMAAIAPGKKEAEVAGAMQGAALVRDRAQAFSPIVSIRGEVLHNTSYANTMRAGDLLLIDSGAESAGFYASDITRTFPVSGRFTDKQKAIYNTVLAAQLAVIKTASPEVSNRDLHFVAARTMASGLKDLGLMKGDMEEAIAAGAHALFFVHGIGHMLGLDVHDMEDLGDVVGYPEDEKRSKQFGLSYLRLAKKLKPGFVITVEPGIYFVPALIDIWAKEKKHKDFIDYAKVEKFRAFGGVRIEDDLLITESGCRVLGPLIPKTVEEIEEKM